LIFVRSHVWGTLKRYLMYTTAGFVVLGGLGAAWSHRPAAIEEAAAAQNFASPAAADAFIQSAASNAPAWTQRMVADLAQQAPQIAAVAPTLAPKPMTTPSTTKVAAIVPTLKPVTMSETRPPLRLDKDERFSSFAETTSTFDTSPFDTMLSAEVAALAPSDQWGNGPSITEEFERDIQKVVEVHPGDTLYGVLVDAGVTEDEAHNAVGAISDVFSPRALRAGQEITLKISAVSRTRDTINDPRLLSLSFEPSVTKDVQLTRAETGDFVAAAVDKPIVERNRRAAGVIDSSLFEAAEEAGVPMPVVADLIKTFSFDVDFQRDIQDGDAFEVFYERMENENGEFVKSGKILYASLTLSGRSIPVYYFERDGEGEYFTPKGEAIRKSLLRTPVDGARITSGFGMRMHPVLGYSKMHKGIDFGAPTGTPIYAAGSGTVVSVEKSKSYGNYVRIRHTGDYQTAYAHMSKFAKGISKGDKVKQGQVIGYVGATGRATGPHLHYEIMIAGKQVNPGKVKTTAANKLAGKQLKAFQAQMAKIEAEMKRQAEQSLIAERSETQIDCGAERGCEN
jgi:murein DD-endopeptidase MepM/ murein hydrolase activator NlpD